MCDKVIETVVFHPLSIQGKHNCYYENCKITFIKILNNNVLLYSRSDANLIANIVRKLLVVCSERF